MIVFTTPVGRMVQGHPMEARPVIDDKTKLPKKNVSGEAQQSVYVAIAIPKGPESHWNQTEWGRLIYNEGVQGWPNGEYNAPAFAWKMVDGDSQIPDKKGIKPCDREGFPGHWVIKASNGFVVPSFHTGRYQPHEVIQNKNEIKCGDYIRMQLNVKGNNPSQSPGVYINPVQLELCRAGIAIISMNAPDANEAFGSSAPVMPANAQIDTSVAAPVPTTPTAAPAAPVPGAAMPPPPIAPAPEFLDPTAEKFNVNGQVFTRAQLTAGGWSEAQIVACPKA